MTGNELILTYDVGTTGNKCTLFDGTGREICAETVAYKTIYPKPGWAEQDPEDFWRSVITGTRALLERSGIRPSSIARDRFMRPYEWLYSCRPGGTGPFQ
ncbi:MAG: FGGY family carbohydrate kinase [Clostridia bacterium]|jgi:xylulokinase